MKFFIIIFKNFQNSVPANIKAMRESIKVLEKFDALLVFGSPARTNHRNFGMYTAGQINRYTLHIDERFHISLFRNDRFQKCS